MKTVDRAVGFDPAKKGAPSMIARYGFWVTLAIVIALGFLNSGCAALGLTQVPQTFNERVAYGFQGIAAAHQTLQGLLSRDRISGAEAKAARNMLACSEEILILARGKAVDAPSCKEPAVVAVVKQLAQGIPQDPQARLVLALNVLTSVEGYLKQRGG